MNNKAITKEDMKQIIEENKKLLEEHERLCRERQELLKEIKKYKGSNKIGKKK